MPPIGARLTATYFFLIIHFLVALAQVPGAFYEDTKSCHPDCSKYGNCNGETGQCDCPFGLTGPSCTKKLFPACHSSHDNGTLPHYGTWYPKNCYCVKQLRDHPNTCPPYLHYEGTGPPLQAPCLYDIVMHDRLICFRYKDKPESQQLSDSPAVDDPNVEWVQVRAYPVWHETEAEPPKTLNTPDGGIYRPLKECPDRCNNRGWCQSLGGNNLGEHHHDPEERWCQCHSFFQGKACEIADPIHCYRNCSGVGTCQGGWCHCQPGYWGHGCTRTKAYSSNVGWRPNHAAIKIYVYDMPSMIVHRREFNDQWSYIDLMYNAELEFTEQLLGDWGVRTENPWEAALFYVPTFTYWYTGNIGHPHYIIQHVIHHLRQLYPFFDATAGRNHVMWATNDRGACKMQMSQLELQHPIKLVHFGQAPRHAYLRKGHMGAHGAGLAGEGGIGTLLAALPLPGHRFAEFPEFNTVDILDEHEICIRPEKDVVSPNVLHNAWVEPATYSRVWDTKFVKGERVVTRREDDPGRRPVTLFFGGYTKDVMTYSQGVRQALNVLFGPNGKYSPQGPNARKDYVITGPTPDAVDMMQKSKFCLAPMGAGWGIRLTEAMVTGCVPVVIQDHVYQPLWDVVPFEEFSLRFSRHDVSDLVEHLDDVTPEQLARLQAGVEKYHRAFMWDAHYGGLAYNYTITALRRRAMNLWSEHFRRHHHHRRSERRHHLRSSL